MKIGLVCPYNMFQFAGGVQEIVLQLQDHLQARGHKVLVITPRPRQHFADAPKDIIMVGRSTKINTLINGTMVDYSFQPDTEEIEEILNRENFDILHFHEPWIPFLSRQILTRSSSVNIATFHAKLPDTIMSRSLLNAVVPYTKSVLNYLHAYTAVSEAAADYLRTLTDETINIVPNGIDLKKYKRPKDIQKYEKKTILYLGRLEKRKGVKYLVEAFEQLRYEHEDVRLLIAGKGVKLKSLEKYIEQNKIPDIHFLGYIDENKKVELISSADVFSSPAIYGESFGIVLLEAMALGTPIVAGNNPGYASVMRGRGRLSLVNPESTDDFAQRLELLLYDEGIRTLWQKWAMSYVKDFNFKNVANMYEAIYQKEFKKHG